MTQSLLLELEENNSTCWCDYNNTDFGNIYCNVAGIYISHLDIDNPNHFLQIYEKIKESISHDEHVSFLTILSPAKKIRTQYRSRELEIGDLEKMSIDNSKGVFEPGGLDTIMFRLRIKQEDIDLHSTPDHRVSLEDALELVVVTNGYIISIFSNELSHEVRLEVNSTANNVVMNIFRDYGVEMIPPSLIGTSFVIEKNLESKTLRVASGGLTVPISSVNPTSDLKSCLRAFFNYMLSDLEHLYSIAQESNNAHLAAIYVYEFVNRILEYYSVLLSIKAFHIFRVRSLLKKINQSVVTLLQQVNNHYASYQSAEIGIAELEKKARELSLSKQISEEIVSLHGEYSRPDFDFVKLMIEQVSKGMQSLKSYYIAILASLLGAISGGVVGALITIL